MHTFSSFNYIIVAIQMPVSSTAPCGITLAGSISMFHNNNAIPVHCGQGFSFPKNMIYFIEYDDLRIFANVRKKERELQA